MLKTWIKLFGRDRVTVVDLDDFLKTSPLGELDRLQRFVGLDVSIPLYTYSLNYKTKHILSKNIYRIFHFNI